MANHKMNIQTFKEGFDGGTRPNRFVVGGEMYLPSVNGDGKGSREAIDMSKAGNHLLVKAASMPSQTLGILQVPFRGRFAKLPGDRAYPEWTFTVLDEPDKGAASLRRKFELWHSVFNPHASNKVSDPANILSGKGDAYTEWTVTQLDMLGDEIRVVRLHKCWPVEVGAIDLSYDTADTLTEFSVTLAYDYLTLEDTTTDTKSQTDEDADPNAAEAAAKEVR